MFTAATVFSALELGFIYALVAMALFLSFRILNIADMSTDGTFTLGCAVSATAAVAGHPVLGLFLAIAAGAASGFVTATLQTRLGVPSILAGIITVNTETAAALDLDYSAFNDLAGTVVEVETTAE